MRRDGPSTPSIADAARVRGPGVFSLAIALLMLIASAQRASAQEWRGRMVTRWSFLDARPLVRDSVPVNQATADGSRFFVGDTLVSCAPGALHCFFYRAGPIEKTAPVVADLSANVWGLGIEGLRAHASVRLRAALGSEGFWPRSTDHFDVFTAYVELNRERFRARLGRDYQSSGLGFYGYDGGSLIVRLPARSELEAYGGWGLARGIPEPVNSDALSSLEEFQPRKRNLLFGFRGATRPTPGLAVEAIYHREIATDFSGIASERIAADAAYSPSARLRLRGHLDYDLGAGWLGKAGVSGGYWITRSLFLEARYTRYRPAFSLQTIWVAFSPVAYDGAGLSFGVRPVSNLTLDLSGEYRKYGDTQAEVPFHVTTDRTWRGSASLNWRPEPRFDIDAAYWLEFTFGAATHSGRGRVAYTPRDDITVALAVGAFQQLEEFRVEEGRVWSIGADAAWRTPYGSFWGSVDRYDHDRRGDAAALDWNQYRAEVGWAVYLGPEPGGRL